MMNFFAVHSRSARLGLILFLLALRVLAPASATAAQLTVTNLDDSGPGTLREALLSLDPSPATNTISLIATGTIWLADSLPDVTNSVDLIGPGPSLLTLTGNGEARLFHLIGPGLKVSFSGLTLAQGYDGAGGGAVRLEEGDEATSLSFTNCVLSNNDSGEANGGAVSAVGAVVTAGVIQFVDCTLRDNSAGANGGAIDSPGAVVHLIRCALYRNFAYGSGGAISVGAGSVTMENCTISGNESEGDGGGINSNYAATYDIRSCTVVSNLTHSTGGGLSTVSSSPTFVLNSIIAGNGFGPTEYSGDWGEEDPFDGSGADVSGYIDSLGHNLIGNTNGASGFIASDLLSLDPLLGPIEDNGGPTLTHAVPLASSALNAGDGSSIAATDQRGFPRLVGTNVDIGAFEAQSAPPTLVCPADSLTTNDTGQCSALVFFAPVATGVPAPSVDCVPPSGAAFPVGTNLVSCSASNSAGTAACSFTVTVVDNQSPILTACPASITQTNDLGQCSTVVTYGAPTATDNCDVSVTVLCVPSSGSTFPKGTNTVTCTATDAATNQSTCSFTVTVNDTEKPSITCPANLILNTAPGVCTAVATWPVPGASDNCTAVSVVCNPVSGSTFPKGTTPVTCTATDGSGNTNACSFTVTVMDNQSPILTACPASITQTNDLGQCSAVATYSAPTATDNCDGSVTVLCVPSSGSAFPKGTNTVTCMATDAATNQSTCSFTVTVNDTEKPSITCPANLTLNTAPSACTAVATWPVPGASDNCTAVSVVCNPVSGSTFPKGVTPVTCTATDGSGNTNACSFTVRVVDNQSPILTACPASITQTNDLGQCSAVVTYSAPTATDNCDVSVTVLCVPSSGSAFAKGTNTVTCTATDAATNQSTCSFTVTVNDTEKPSITCPANLTLNTAPGVCTAVATWPVPGAGDNCIAVSVICNPVSGSTFPKGTTPVTCTATDGSGNTNACSFTVTVVDNQSPILTACPASITQTNDLGQCSAVVTYSAPTATDNCDASVTVLCVPSSGSTFPKGTNTVTCTATDAATNQSTCSFTVTVNDTEKPSITCPANLTLNTAPGACTAVATWPVPGASDNCTAVSVVCNPVSGSTFPKGATSVICTATDGSGNTNACSFTVRVVDNQSPILTACPASITQSNDLGQCSAVVTYSAPTATDNCDASVTVFCVPSSGATFPKGTNTVTCTATDAATNQSTCSFTVTVNDTEKPSITCPANITQTNDLGQCSAVVTWPAPSASDNCAAVSVVCNPVTGSIFPKGTNTVTCTATDGSGNTKACSFTVTVNDTEKPSVTCSSNLVLECTGPSGTIATFPFSYADNCPGVTGSCVPPSGSALAPGVHPVKCLAIDAVGNTNQCVFTVTVRDTLAPTIACPPNLIVAELPHDSGLAPVTYSAPVTTDICDGTVPVVCSPPSGTSFAVGYTTVKCVATDAGGNTNACSFSVRVIPYRLIVTTTNDAGPGSLRQALLDANDGPGENRVEFHLPGSFPTIIAVLSALPVQTSPVIIDGWTQPGFNGVPLVELDGSQSHGADGLVLIAGNSTIRGLVLHGFSTAIRLATNGGNTIQGNFIGSDATGTNGPGNTTDGLFINSPRNLIGGTSAGVGNIIAFNGQSGVSVGSSVAVRNSILGNSIFSNSALGIDLNADGVTLNDPNDVDEGPNRLQNFPILSDVSSVDGVTTIDGTINTTASGSFRLEFFLNDLADPSGFGEGEYFLGSATVITRANGSQDFSVFFSVPATSEQFVTATATDTAGNTSEFSPAFRVRTPPVLQAQPIGTNAPAGTAVTLCASAGGTPPFTWQWRLNGANIPGATNPCYIIASAQLANAGVYTVVVGNDLGAQITTPAPLTLPLPGVNGADYFTNRVTLTGTNGTVAGSNRFATHEPGEPEHAGKPGGKSVWYTWKAKDTGIVTIGTTGSTFDTLLAVYQGTKVTNLTVVASDEDRGGFFTSGIRFNAIKDQTYQIAVDGYYGAEGEFVLNWSQEKTSHLLPAILVQPQSVTVAFGANVAFVVDAEPVCSDGHIGCDDLTHYEDSDEPDIDYQWYLNGIPIPGATKRFLSVTNIQGAAVGDYTVRVSAVDKKFTRTIESDAATVQINLIGSLVENVQSFDKIQDASNAPPIILGVAAPISLSLAGDGNFSSSAAGVVRGYTGTQIFNTTNSSSQGEIFCGVAGGASRWVSLVAEAKGRLIVTTDGSTFDTLLAVITPSPTNPAVQVAYCDNNSGSNGLTSRLVVSVAAGTTNSIGVDGVKGSSGVLQLNFSLCPDASMIPMGLAVGGARKFRVNGRSGLPLTIQISPDMNRWSTLLVTTPLTEVLDFVDPTPPSNAPRFYRALICE